MLFRTYNHICLGSDFNCRKKIKKEDSYKNNNLISKRGVEIYTSAAISSLCRSFSQSEVHDSDCKFRNTLKANREEAALNRTVVCYLARITYIVGKED